MISSFTQQLNVRERSKLLNKAIQPTPKKAAWLSFIAMREIERFFLRLIAFVSLFSVFMAAYGASSLDTASEILSVASGKEVRPFATRDFGRDQYRGARSVLVSEEDAKTVLDEVRDRIPPGIVAFVGTTRSLATPKSTGVEVVIAPGSSQFDILRVAASDGINYDLTTEDLVRELTSWDEAFGVDIWQAETDTIQLRLKSLPKDMMKFARRVYEFCPDIVDQGTGSVEELGRSIQAKKEVFLWWD